MSRIALSQDIQKKMTAGIEKLADAVKVTIGPLGRNTVLHQKANLRGADYSDAPRAGSHVLMTNDGVTIAKSIVLSDPYENMGASLLREAAIRTNETAGDGTSTTIVLAESLLSGAFCNIAAGAEPVPLRLGIRAAAEAAIKALAASAVAVNTQEELSLVAATACQDDRLGSMIGEALHTVGPEGVINVTESGRPNTTLVIEQGIVLDRGLISPLMATDEGTTTAELQNPLILICDQKFTEADDLIPALILAAEAGRSCLIVCDGVEGNAMGLILKNKLEGDMEVVCVTAPLYGEGRRWRMEDLAVQVGGVFLTEELGYNIRQITPGMFGHAGHVKVTKSRTIITEPGGRQEEIQKQIQKVRYLAEHTDYGFNKKRYQERLARFVSGIAYIEVGGQTEPELWERKMRTEDAVCAAQAACKNGIVPGGGIALLNLVPILERLAEEYDGEQKLGVRVVMEALKAPAKQIAENAGIDGSALLAELAEKKPGTGYDLFSGKYVDMLSSGIADPFKVTSTALQSACSIAASILTTEAGVLASKKETGNCLKQKTYKGERP